MISGVAALGTAFSQVVDQAPYPPPPPLNTDTPASASIRVPETLKVEPDEAKLCADAEARGEPIRLGCAERRLRDKAAKTPPVLNVPPLDARSNALELGAANEAAVKQQYGKNYGVDTTPFRPNRIFRSPASPPRP